MWKNVVQHFSRNKVTLVFGDIVPYAAVHKKREEIISKKKLYKKRGKIITKKKIVPIKNGTKNAGKSSQKKTQKKQKN